jgi:hypothetical protein
MDYAGPRGRSREVNVPAAPNRLGRCSRSALIARWRNGRRAIACGRRIVEDLRFFLIRTISRAATSVNATALSDRWAAGGFALRCRHADGQLRLPSGAQFPQDPARSGNGGPMSGP